MVEKTPLFTRVSEGSFAIRVNEITQDQPLGILHVRLTKPTQSHSSGSTPAFYCPCHSFTQFSSRASGGPKTARLSRRCSHFYIWLWAFASDKSLSEEFQYPGIIKRYACLWCSTASITMHLNSTLLITLFLDEPQTARDCTSERDTMRSNGKHSLLLLYTTFI